MTSKRREFWSRANDTPNLWAVPFDSADPVQGDIDRRVAAAGA